MTAVLNVLIVLIAITRTVQCTAQCQCLLFLPCYTYFSLVYFYSTGAATSLLHVFIQLLLFTEATWVQTAGWPAPCGLFSLSSYLGLLLQPNLLSYCLAA